MEFVCHSCISRGKWLWTNYKPQWWKSILHRRNVYPRKLFCRYFSILTCKSCRQLQSDSQTWPSPNSQLKYMKTRLKIHLFCLDRQAPITVTIPQSQSHGKEWVCSKETGMVIKVWCNLKMRKPSLWLKLKFLLSMQLPTLRQKIGVIIGSLTELDASALQNQFRFLNCWWKIYHRGYGWVLTLAEMCVTYWHWCEHWIFQKENATFY